MIAVDIIAEPAGLAEHSNVSYHRCDQTDGDTLRAVVEAMAPRGFDFVVDDASHCGWRSWTSFQALWPQVRAGGYYVIEDWTTGYQPTWPDGAAQVEPGGGIATGMLLSHNGAWSAWRSGSST